MKIKKKYSSVDISTLERAFIDSFLHQNNLESIESSVITKFLNKKDYIDVSKFITEKVELKDLDQLVTAFECLISGDEKKNNGVVYTPPEIRNYISNRVIDGDFIPKIIDPACGCGAFLISVSRRLHERYKLSYSEIIEKYIWGCDIDAHSIEKCEILLEILCIQEDGSSYEKNFNFVVGNSFETLTNKTYKGQFDVVIGNPPYVRSKNIDKRVKKSLTSWKVVSGNVDLYIPFYQLGIELLKENGVLGYISPNTYLQSVNGRRLRNYIRDNKYYLEIINFKESQRFLDVTHYTCITIICKGLTNNIIKYAVCDGDLESCEYTDYDISLNQDNQEWRFGNKKIDSMIYKIEHQPDKLENYNIRNGLATLCNELFFFDVDKETDDYYIRNYQGKEYKIEKSICINIAKPNIMRDEYDLELKGEKAIFPYKKGKIISEDEFKSEYPSTYAFLLDNKRKLLNRDKGKIDDYPAWYAYGRTQGMKNQGRKVLIPYMADRGVAIIAMDDKLLFYCGYAAFSDDITTLKLLKTFIESDVFWFYVKMTSKPYSKGYMALAKNYIKNFGLPNLSDEEKTTLLSISNAKERDLYIARLYDLDYEEICEYIKISA